ncbi:RsmB/NOP family class I SAM-dependent RNA methyltransferase [Candidatus Saccharibacteria bacterium]|nr:RsmB/NOP family class I SAM-dependent RNA methyltransferase [Candidatus Saccharibacteria bacterium]
MVKRTNLIEKRQAKKILWTERTALWSGLTMLEIKDILETPRSQSLRQNTLKSAKKLNYTQIDWSVDGYEISASQLEEIKNSKEVADGKLYVQNAASWLPVYALNPKAGEVILDVCAAPGGKSSHIQALTRNQSKLVCNDNSKPRLIKLQTNMERLGAKAGYTLCDATRLRRLFDIESFDKILLDAPCSGEGLMTLSNDKLFDSWSIAHIRRLSDLQKKILTESWQVLKPGGTLVYSTCTMAPEENESVVDYHLRKHSDATLQTLDFSLINRVPTLKSWNDRRYTNDLSPCLRLLPSPLTEAFFVAKLVKSV